MGTAWVQTHVVLAPNIVELRVWVFTDVYSQVRISN